MGISVVNSQPVAERVLMESTSSAATTKVERRVVEKNRRNQMKNLYSQLNSLLPNHNSKEATSVPKQIDEAINYIKSLESNLIKYKQNRDSLSSARKKRSYEICDSNIFETRSAHHHPSAKPPEIQIHESGSSLEVVLSTGRHNQFIFYDIIRILDKEQADIVQASFSASGDSILHLVHAEMGKLMLDFGAARISEKLKRIINGSTSDEEVRHDDYGQDYIWDFQIHPQTWDF